MTVPDNTVSDNTVSDSTVSDSTVSDSTVPDSTVSDSTVPDGPLPYRGRFAPSPSGPLHFGSLFAAVVSYLDAKAHQGKWLVRIEDLDPAREQAGASAGILATLAAHGLEWDERETYQSDQIELYRANLATLQHQERLYWCRCSRKQLSGQAVYPGTCAQQRRPLAEAAIRFQTLSEQDRFVDRFQGLQTCAPREQAGDVVVVRKDGLYAYQLAVVSDDISHGISHVVRGIDILDSVWWQRELYRALGSAAPQYGHFPVLLKPGSEQKLSKQNRAPAVQNQTASANLVQIFRALGMNFAPDRPPQLLQQALAEWRSGPLSAQIHLQSQALRLD
jgi:glutamyl-Q tRNA(Asp) synthetase